MENALPADTRPGGVDLARLRVSLTYRWRHGRWPDLANPTTFTERIQHRKLRDRDARMPVLADKVRAKIFAEERLGADWIIPTLWHGTALPAEPEWPAPFVVKSRHGCNQRAFVRTGAEDWQAIRRRAARWMQTSYGGWLDEWAYSQIPRGILVEPFVGEHDTLPVDWKIYVFGGRACFVQVHLERETHHRWIVMDRDWRRASSRNRDADPAKPESLAAMIAAAETLATGFNFVRVDFYEIGGQPLFGEMTFYPGSGLDPFNPVALDGVMGQVWLYGKL
jgi:TupA-like ATPgrasp